MIPLCDPARCEPAGCTATVCIGAGVPSNDELFERSTAVIPGGVNSPARAFGAVGGEPIVFARGEGAYRIDGVYYRGGSTADVLAALHRAPEALCAIELERCGLVLPFDSGHRSAP